jgi:hypothetical protein
VDRDGSGRLRVQQDEQTWDQVVSVVAAWNHDLVTGDREFLRSADEATRNTLRIRASAVSHTLDPVHGLFTGPSFFNDGIAGYAEAVATAIATCLWNPRTGLYRYAILADVVPAFARYSEARPGRHNAMIWPLVRGLWARADAADARGPSAHVLRVALSADTMAPWPRGMRGERRSSTSRGRRVSRSAPPPPR